MNSVLAAFFTLSILTLTSPSIAATEVDKQAFKVSYSQYKNCIKNKPSCVKSSRTAFEAGLKIFDKNSKNLAALHYNFGRQVLKHGGKNREERAYAILQAALPVNEQAFGKNSIQVLALLVDLTDAQKYLKYEDKNRYAYWKRAVKLSKKLNGDNTLEHAIVLSDISSFLLHGFGYSSRTAKKYLDKSYEIFKTVLDEDDIRIAYSAFNLGKYKVSGRHFKEAIPYLESALAIYEKNLFSRRLEKTTRAFLVQAYEEIGEREKATEHILVIGSISEINNVDQYFPVYKKRAKYPENALKDEKEGFAIVEFTVNRKGLIEDVEVVKYGGSYAFAKAAVKSIKHYRYAPRFVDGKAVKTTNVRQRIDFIIRNN